MVKKVTDKLYTILSKQVKIYKIPHYVLPRQIDPYILDLYDISPITIKRDVKCGSEKENRSVRFSKENQKIIYNNLCGFIRPLKPYVVGISSVPNDVIALEATGYVIYSLMKNNRYLSCLWINAARFSQTSDTPDVVIIYNIFESSYRSQQVRDILCDFPNSLRIVVVPNIEAIKYFDNNIHHGLSGFIHFNGNLLKPLISYRLAKEYEVKCNDACINSDMIELLSGVPIKVLKSDELDGNGLKHKTKK